MLHLLDNLARRTRALLSGAARLSLTGAIGLAAFASALLFVDVHPTKAVVSGTPCAGNVCTGTITVGGQAVAYSYTQHLSSNGQFRIRFNGGVYNTTGTVSFELTGLPAFASTGYTPNPTNGAASMSNSVEGTLKTTYERYDPDGCPSCIFDHVMSVQYSGLTAGSYTFNFTIRQNGSTGGVLSLPFYVDAGAPSNANESTAWASIASMDRPCADGVDNNINFYADCADTQCSGSVGQWPGGALCSTNENSDALCMDSFDNDGDNNPDCRDSGCNGFRGDTLSTARCQYQNERNNGTCGDGFDNDGDGKTDCVDNSATDGSNANMCWKQAGYGCPATENSCTDGIDNDKDMSYASTWDSGSLTGVDCQDYDCLGNAACQSQENYTVGGVNNDALCFDTLDNDLDGATDCSDTNCAAAINPSNPNQVCYGNEFDLGQRYQYCANSFDDDGDGASDCSDPSCKQQFGNCGPCPSREDYTWNACADGSDNDSDAVLDCSDAQCHGDLGSTSTGGMCAAAEDTNVMCADGFDNDVDGSIDCADSGCAGRTGPLGVSCQPTGETSCADGLDNDSDGLIDVVDPNCASATWTQSACVTVPSTSGATAFTSDNPTVTARVRLTTRVSSTDVLQFTGTASYSSVTIIIGDNTTPTSYYPYAETTCTLTGTNASLFGFTVVSGHAVQIFSTTAGTINGFDITLTCSTPSTPATIKYYPISLSALKTPSNYPEYGDLSFSTTLYEATLPTMTSVTPEGVLGATVSVPYSTGGVTRRFRGIPNDPAPSSGICSCVIKVGTTELNASGSDCISPQVAFTDDIASLAVSGKAIDGAGNEGAYNTATNYAINVTPSVTTPLTLSPSSPFFSATSNQAAYFSAKFRTANSDSFVSTCGVYLYNSVGTLASGGPIGPSFTIPAIVVPGINYEMTCQGSATISGGNGMGSLPSGLGDGTYVAKVRAMDGDSNYVFTNGQPLYICNSLPSAGDPEPTNGCQYADFDFDGASEGLFTTKYAVSGMACDNCVNLSNAAQTDANANGIGDMCEPDEDYGRCEIDTDIVCLYDSDKDPECTGSNPDEMCCPGPSQGDDPLTGAPKNPQMCKDSGQCTVTGDICFVDTDCTGGPGDCQDGTTACYKDSDCSAVSGTPTCTGADRCDSLIYPWIETKFGNVFSNKKIIVGDVPPKSLYNATYCVTAKETILNFRTEGKNSCAALTDAAARPSLPKSSNTFTTVKGTIDLVGLRSGKYGTVTTLFNNGAQLSATLTGFANRMGGRVIHVTGDATVSARTILNDNSGKGNGTVLIDGGNLTITGDIGYDGSTVDDVKKLASMGWIVNSNGVAGKGNVYIDPGVTQVVGAFYANGDDGFTSVTPPAVDSDIQLTVYGLVIAKEFNLSRSFKSASEGAERFIYDGRAVVNPPPGFTDITKSLPIFSDTPSQ